MLRQQAKLFNKLSICVDICFICISLVLGYHVRSLFKGKLLPLDNYLWVLVIVIPVWFYLLKRNGLYSSIRRCSIFDIVSKLFNVHLLGGFLTSSVIYFVDRDQYSRGLYLAFLGTSFLLLSLVKVSVRLVLGFCRRRGVNTRHLLIVGTREKALRLHQLVEQHAAWGLLVAGFVQVGDAPVLDEVEGHKVLGQVDELLTICKSEQIDEVIFCLPKDFIVDAEAYLQDLEELGVTVRMVLDFYDFSFYRRELSFFHDELPILTYHPKAFEGQQLFVKRTLDIFGALCGLVITTVLFPFIVLSIKFDSPGPIFFGQQRIGENGRSFRCWKFRSMFVDAEERKQELLAQNEMNGAIFKIKNDPRITKVGSFLRKTSLDEFPQFWNVLKGNMSLVGTRPPTPDEVAQYENWHRRRISIKPGITGMWQISGRNKIEDFDEIVRLDLHYIDNWSIWLDILILFKTVKAVLAGSGSY
ncbi:MAG: UDP-phosphate galactose phosphotransferase [Desulfuromonadales bacterium C00003107]|nr:MAG: UDP-phosphate galactose phosphotransferase [Desulfuromonadales bacterium C00003107]